MISQQLAAEVAAARASRGLGWVPESGDRFVMPGKDIDGVFVVADMTIEVAEYPTGRLIRFNGTTEWALDSIQADEVLWLPREGQLRDMLGDRFVRLERLTSPAGSSCSPTVRGTSTPTPRTPARGPSWPPSLLHADRPAATGATPATAGVRVVGRWV